MEILGVVWLWKLAKNFKSGNLRGRFAMRICWADCINLINPFVLQIWWALWRWKLNGMVEGGHLEFRFALQILCGNFTVET